MTIFYKHLRYNPAASIPENSITDEKNYLLDGAIVKPKFNTYFYGTGFQIKGFNIANPSGVILTLGTDYNLVITDADYTVIIGEPIYKHAVLTNLTFDTVEISYTALGSDIYYDATGVEPLNYILNEIFPIGSINKIKPYNFTYFFKTGLSVRGRTIANPGGVALVSGTDYTVSPKVQPFTDSLGTDIHDFFVLSDTVMNTYEWITFSYHALGNYLPYDPTGTASTNDVANEVHIPDTSACIVPLANSAFTKGSFEAIGYNGTYPSGVVLKEINDYFFSPMYLTYSAAMAKEIYSYIVLMQPSNWDSIEIEYHATGGSLDATLYAEIANAGAFDKNDPLEWMNFKGQTNTLSIGYLYDEEPDQSYLRILNTKLNEIKIAIENLPAAPTINMPGYITTAFNDIITQLNNQQSFFNNAIGELSTYGSLSTRIKLIVDPTYTVLPADLGYTLLFSNTGGCVLTTPSTLPANMWFKVLQDSSAGQVTWADNTTAPIPITFFNSGSIVLTTKDPGDLCTFLKVGVNKYLTTSSRTEVDDSSNFVFVNNSTLLIDPNLHNNKTLIFVYATGDVEVTVPDTLPNGMNWKEYKRSIDNKVTHITSGTATLISTNGITVMDRQGDSLEFVKLELGVPTFTVTSNRDSFSGINRVKVIATNDHSITNADNGYTLLFTSIANGIITISDDLVSGFACQIYKTEASATAAFLISHSVSVTKEGTYNPTGLTAVGELIDIRQYEPNKYILNSNQKSLPNDVVTTSILNAALATISNKPVRVRQCAMSGDTDGIGQAAWLAISGSDVVSLSGIGAVDKYITFGDGFDSLGEKNYVVKIPKETAITWAGVVSAGGQTIDDGKFLYLDLDPGTGIVTPGSHSVKSGASIIAPVYSLVKPAGVNGLYWYPTDHRSRGEVYQGGNWAPILRLYVGYVDTKVYSFCYNGATELQYVWQDTIVAAGPNHELVPFSGDNCDYDVRLYMRVDTITDSLSGAGYDVGEILEAPMVHYDSAQLHGFSIVRKPTAYNEVNGDPLLNGLIRYKAFQLLQNEWNGSYLNKTWLINRVSTIPIDVKLNNFTFLLYVRRTF